MIPRSGLYRWLDRRVQDEDPPDVESAIGEDGETRTIPPIGNYVLPDVAATPNPPNYLDLILWDAYGGRMNATPEGQEELLHTHSPNVVWATGAAPQSRQPADWRSPRRRLERSDTPQAQAVRGFAQRLGHVRPPISEALGRGVPANVVDTRPARRGGGLVAVDALNRVIGTLKSEDSPMRPRGLARHVPGTQRAV